jgi:F-type H+-transporting ATPase subunit b
MLKPNIWTVLFQIVNFLAMAAVLYFLIFKPIMHGMRKQAAEKERAQHEMEKHQAELIAERNELTERLANVKDEAQRIVTDAQDRAEALRQALHEEAEKEAERVLTEAHADAERIQEQLISDFQDDLVRTILTVSSHVIGRITPVETQNALVQQLNDRIWAMGRDEIERVEEFRRTLGTRIPTAYITTAKPMTAEQQALLTRTFAALADRQVNVDVRINPALAAGLRVRLGDRIIDNSVAGQLEELQSSVAESLKKQMQGEVHGT